MIIRSVFILSITLMFIFLSPSNALAGKITTITVDVEETQAGGQSWDIRKGAPDLSLCISHSLVGTLCLPEGDSVNVVTSAECKDSYHCRFSVQTPDKDFKISIVDVDLVLNDLIGTGHCARHMDCAIGQANVFIN